MSGCRRQVFPVRLTVMSRRCGKIRRLGVFATKPDLCGMFQVSLNTSPVQSREPSPKKQEADGSGLALRQYEPFNMWAAQTVWP